MNRPSGSPLCPRCQLPLHVGQAGGESLYGCAACGGIWLDSHGSARLTQALDTEALALADSAAEQACHQVDTTAADLPCPVCQQPLVRRHVDRANVELDDCPKHGSWFDRNELQTVARSLAAARAYGGGGAPAPAGAGPGAAKQRAREDREDTLEAAAEVATVAAVATVDGECVVAGAEIVAEGAGGLLAGAFSLLGDIFDGLG